jgi:hypothetical protein
MEVKKLVRKNDYKEDEKEPEESSTDSKIQIVTESQLLNAKLDHIIAILEKEFKD